MGSSPILTTKHRQKHGHSVYVSWTVKTNIMHQVKRKVKNWFRDKWNWLLTFNKPPKVTINQDLVSYEGNPPAVIMDGRVIVQVNGNITYKPLRGTLELKGHIKSK